MKDSKDFPAGDAPLPALQSQEALQGSRLAASLREFDLASLDDVGVATFMVMVDESRKELVSVFREIELSAKTELLTRMKRNGAREIASPRFKKIARVDDFSTYSFDLEVIEKELVPLLSPVDAAKVLVNVPERVVVVAAHKEAGPPASFSALVKRFGEESQVGKIIARCMTRSKLGESVKVEPYIAPKTGGGK